MTKHRILFLGAWLLMSMLAGAQTAPVTITATVRQPTWADGFNVDVCQITRAPRGAIEPDCAPREFVLIPAPRVVKCRRIRDRVAVFPAMRIGTFCAYVYADHVSNPLERYSNFAKSQIEYALGTNPAGRSYVCGFGNKLPFNPHHRNSHASVTNDINSPATNRHVLFGALVGGPDANDGYADVRTDYVRNEVAMDYNAGFTGAVARLYRESGGFTLNETVTPPAPVTLLRSTLDDFPTGPKTEVEWKALWPGSGGHGSDSEPSPFRSYRHPRRQWNGLARSRRQGRAPLPPAAQHRPEDLDRVNRKRATVA